MKEIGIAIGANTLITMKNGKMVYVEDDTTSITRRMKEDGEDIVITISTALEGIMRSVKKDDIEKYREI